MQAKELLAAINPHMRLTREFLRDIYAAGMSDPDFPDKAIAALEAAGCSKAREYYETWVNEYESEHETMLKEVANWYAEECRKERERKVRESRRIRQNLTRDELTELCQKLLQEGVIETPEQFVTAVFQDL